MKKMIQRLWKDEGGFIISMELVLVATILVIGLVAGMGSLRDAVNSEMNSIAQAIESVDQTFGVGGVQNATSTGDGSQGFSFTDTPDPGLAAGAALTYVPSGVTVSISASTPGAIVTGS